MAWFALFIAAADSRWADCLTIIQKSGFTAEEQKMLMERINTLRLAKEMK
jgi:hypothetical protein